MPWIPDTDLVWVIFFEGKKNLHGKDLTRVSRVRKMGDGRE
jgi:hypothetical protein